METLSGDADETMSETPRRAPHGITQMKPTAKCGGLGIIKR